MFEAQVEEDRPLALAGTDTDGHGDAWHDLEAILAIDGPAEAGIHEEGIHPLLHSRTCHLLATVVGKLQHGVEGGPGQPDETLAKVPGREIRLLA